MKPVTMLMSRAAPAELAATAGETAHKPAETLILDGIWGGHSRWSTLRDRIVSGIGPCRIWRYDNSGSVSLETLGNQLAGELRGATTPCNLVGFSMGGIVVREALRQDPTLHVIRIVLLHSPHAGTLTACLLPLPATREMRPGSKFLRRLDAAPWRYPTLASWCPGDLVIVPGYSARWKRAIRILRSDVPGHAWPVVSRTIHAAVVNFLAGK